MVKIDSFLFTTNTNFLEFLSEWRVGGIYYFSYVSRKKMKYFSSLIRVNSKPSQNWNLEYGFSSQNLGWTAVWCDFSKNREKESQACFPPAPYSQLFPGTKKVRTCSPCTNTPTAVYFWV